MSKHFSFVIFLTLGVVSDLAQCGLEAQNASVGQNNLSGDTSEKTLVQIRQYCCAGDGNCTKLTDDKTMCNGTFKMVLQNADKMSPAVSMNLQNVLVKVPTVNSRTSEDNGEVIIEMAVANNTEDAEAVDNNSKLARTDYTNINIKLFQTPEKTYEVQYGTTNHSAQLSDVDESIEEEKEPREIKAKQEDIHFKVDYAKKYKRIRPGIRKTDDKYFMPSYKKPSEYYGKVNPIGFSGTEIDRIRREVLHKANFYRSLFGIRELQLNEHVSFHAQDQANTLATRADHMSLYFPMELRDVNFVSNTDYGKNVFTSLPLKYVGEVAVDISYFEVASVDKKNEENDLVLHRNDNTKRLYQLLWMDSVEIGVGAAKGKDGKYYVVMNFNPRGNIEGFMVENIPKFTVEQIQDAKNKMKQIVDNTQKLIDRMGKVCSLPGWKTMLYEIQEEKKEKEIDLD